MSEPKIIFTIDGEGEVVGTTELQKALLTRAVKDNT